MKKIGKFWAHVQYCKLVFVYFKKISVLLFSLVLCIFPSYSRFELFFDTAIFKTVDTKNVNCKGRSYSIVKSF